MGCNGVQNKLNSSIWTAKSHVISSLSSAHLSKHLPKWKAFLQTNQWLEYSGLCDLEVNHIENGQLCALWSKWGDAGYKAKKSCNFSIQKCLVNTLSKNLVEITQSNSITEHRTLPVTESDQCWKQVLSAYRTAMRNPNLYTEIIAKKQVSF